VRSYQALNDVWCSSDGVQWEQVTGKAPGIAYWFSAVVYRDRMWVLGGWSNNPSKNWGDVWHSRTQGVEQLQSKAVWKRGTSIPPCISGPHLDRRRHAQPLNSEVWSLELPKDWLKNK